jgi:acetyl esterase
VTIIRDQAYGEDPRQVLDVYRPTARSGAPVVIFVHGGAYVRGDKDGAGEAYGNIATWFARQGMLGINATYPLAPAAKWPAGPKNVGGMVAWAKANAIQFGGDPNRIVLIGHSAGATHVAGYAFDKSLQPPGGPGIAGAVLISGRYRIDYDPTDPNGRNMQAYFGDDTSQYANRSPINHIRDGARVPVFVVVTEYDNPGLDVRGAELFSALCERDGTCPRFVRLRGHNHLSEILAFNTPDEYLGREVLDFMARGR